VHGKCGLGWDGAWKGGVMHYKDMVHSK
jgi:hypothetical protein